MELFSLYTWLAIFFGFIMAWGIGANDVSNAMGTSVGSNAINLRQAIIIAAIFEFLGAFFAGSEVTNTIRNDLIYQSAEQVSPDILCLGMLASLLSAGCWLLAASAFGWPVSTTHTIVGAIVGFGAIQLGIQSVQWHTVLSIVMGWLFSPFLGALISYSLLSSAQKYIFNVDNPFEAAKKYVPVYIAVTCWIVYMLTISKLKYFGIYLNLFENCIISLVLACLTAMLGRYYISKIKLDPKADVNFHYTNVERIFSVLMVFTACAMAFAHGSNDVANAIGPVSAIISIAQANGNLDVAQNITNTWVLLLGAGGIVCGLAMYGHKVIATIGSKITQLTPSRGFSATLAAASTVLLASATGMPISTTHTLVGGILGVGLARGVHALNLQVIRSIFLSWVVTLPAGAVLAIAFFKALTMLRLSLYL